VNKDGFGRSTFTRFFEDLIKFNANNLLVQDYYDYLSNLDYNQDLALQYDLTDLKYRLTLVSENPYYKFGS